MQNKDLNVCLRVSDTLGEFGDRQSRYTASKATKIDQKAVIVGSVCCALVLTKSILSCYSAASF